MSEHSDRDEETTSEYECHERVEASTGAGKTHEQKASSACKTQFLEFGMRIDGARNILVWARRPCFAAPFHVALDVLMCMDICQDLRCRLQRRRAAVQASTVHVTNVHGPEKMSVMSACLARCPDAFEKDGNGREK